MGGFLTRLIVTYGLRVMQSLGGAIEIESTLGEGAAVWLYFTKFEPAG